MEGHGAHIGHIRPILGGHTLWRRLGCGRDEVAGEEGEGCDGDAKGRVTSGQEPSRGAQRKNIEEESRHTDDKPHNGRDQKEAR